MDTEQTPGEQLAAWMRETGAGTHLAHRIRWVREPGSDIGVQPWKGVPDLDDVPTLGAIEHGVLPEVWGTSATIDVGAVRGHSVWVADVHIQPAPGAEVGEFHGTGPSRKAALAQALVSACLGAPRREGDDG